MKTVIQVYPRNDFKVYVYFDDGKIKLYDVAPLLGKGVFQKISTINEFIEKCTVLNGTLAWDLGGNFDPFKCIDIDPESLYEKGQEVSDPLKKSVA
ncbi:MAG TPA: DUF2442 domain-containing protein [Pseudobdellovibrionaceae bacterium]|nr:DUF2442 domain-containing protein [Pseudobdellovibrionaceae bacterium]